MGKSSNRLLPAMFDGYHPAISSALEDEFPLKIGDFQGFSHKNLPDS